MRVLLLHALARPSASMRKMALALARRGHEPHVLGYRTTHRRLDDAAAEALDELDRLGLGAGGPDLAYVAHSVGGLVVRAMVRRRPGLACWGGVLLGSPLQGTVIAAHALGRPHYRILYGRIFEDMTPAAAQSLPPPPGRFGTISGTKRTPLLPAAHVTGRLAPGAPSDSTVLVAESRHPDEADHLELPVTHYRLPSDRRVIEQVARFLDVGRFDRPAARPAAGP